MLPVFTVVAAVGFLVAVAKFDVVPQGGWRGAGHVTQWTLIMVYCSEREPHEHEFVRTYKQ